MAKMYYGARCVGENCDNFVHEEYEARFPEEIRDINLDQTPLTMVCDKCELRFPYRSADIAFSDSPDGRNPLFLRDLR